MKFQQAELINSDLDMYYTKADTPALCLTSLLVEELGQIEYILSDKTCTLTRKETEFRVCSIGGVAYAGMLDESHGGDRDDKEVPHSFDELRALVSGVANPFVGVGGADSGRHRADELLMLLADCPGHPRGA